MFQFGAQTSFSNNCNNACSTVGIEESNLSNLSIYPNPTTNSISIDLGETVTNLTATLINSFGQVVFVKDYNSTEFIKLDIHTPIGIYFLQLKTSNKVIARKIIKE